MQVAKLPVADLDIHLHDWAATQALAHPAVSPDQMSRLLSAGPLVQSNLLVRYEEVAPRSKDLEIVFVDPQDPLRQHFDFVYSGAPHNRCESNFAGPLSESQGVCVPCANFRVAKIAEFRLGLSETNTAQRMARGH
jgi:hypothetical protein